MREVGSGSYSLAPVHCDSCAISEHLSSVRSFQRDGNYMGEEIYYVPVATAHGAHACVGLPKQIPPGQTHGERHPSVPPGRSRLRSTTEKTGNGMRQSGVRETESSSLTPNRGFPPHGQSIPRLWGRAGMTTSTELVTQPLHMGPWLTRARQPVVAGDSPRSLSSRTGPHQHSDVLWAPGRS